MVKDSKFYIRVARWATGSPATLFLHIAFLLILAGAMITCISGLHGQITIEEMPVNTFRLDDGSNAELPFFMKLDKNVVDYYPASTAPRGYSCEVTVVPAQGQPFKEIISMDHMLIMDHYRFTLVSIGLGAATLTVNHDPWGIAVTYIGYGMLFISILGFFFQPHSGFRTLIRRLGRSSAAVMIFLAMAPGTAEARTAENANSGDAVPAEVARTFGKIYVYWDDRPVPMQTMSRSILTHVYGKDTYCGQSADQVILGFLVYYDKWKKEPLIKVKSRSVRDMIGIKGKYASLTDFFDEKGYKLQPLLDEKAGDNEISRVDRSVQLLSSVATGSIMRIYPYMSANDRMEWLSWTDYRPSRMPVDQWVIIEKSMSDVVTSIIKGNSNKARSGLLAIRNYQLNTAADGGTGLSQSRFKAEIWYNGMASPLWASLLLIALSLAALILLIYWKFSRIVRYIVMLVLLSVALWLTGLIALRWFIACHWPLTNGPEAMEVMALVALLIGIAMFNRYFSVTIASMVVAGMSLAVAAMSGNSSVISPLLPVLNNPLLSIHVFVIMVAYALLTIIMLLSLCVLVSCRFVTKDLSHRMVQISLTMLYPAVSLLCVGIFVGAIWANQSWGRYWGWDPKETCALITMLVYSLPLHWGRLRPFRSDIFLSVYLAASYVMVAVTYFGVNFFLGGMHSYS